MLWDLVQLNCYARYLGSCPDVYNLLNSKGKGGFNYSFVQSTIHIYRETQSLVCKVHLYVSPDYTIKLELVCQGEHSLFDCAGTIKGLTSNLGDKLSTNFLHVMVSISCNQVFVTIDFGLSYRFWRLASPHQIKIVSLGIQKLNPSNILCKGFVGFVGFVMLNLEMESMDAMP